MTEHPYESDADYDRRMERRDKGEDYTPPRRQIGEWPGDPQDSEDESEGDDED